MATSNTTKSRRTELTDRKVSLLQQEAKPYDVSDAICKGLVLRVEASGKKSYSVFLWTPERKRYRWRIGDAATFKCYKKTPTKKADRDQSIRDVAEALKAESRAIDLREQRKAAITKHKSDKTATLQGFIDQVYSDHYAVKNARPEEMIRWIRSSFADLLPMKLQDITHLTIRSWMKKQTTSPATVARKLQLLSGVLTHAVVTKRISSHPLQSAERKVNAINIPEPDNERVRFLDADEESRLRTALKARDASMKAARTRAIEHRQERGLAPPQTISGAYADHLSPLVLLAMNTGIRRGALLGLDWSDISQGQIYVRKELDKAGKGYHVTLSDEASEVLRLWKHQTGGKGLVFKHRGHQIKSIKTSWSNLMRDAKITDFRFHDLRHHFASKLVIGNVPLFTVSKLMGHSSLEMTMRYAHLSPDHMADALKVLNK